MVYDAAYVYRVCRLNNGLAVGLSIEHHFTYRYLREMGGAPRNPAPRNHLLVWIVKPSGGQCRDALGCTWWKQIS